MRLLPNTTDDGHWHYVKYLFCTLTGVCTPHLMGIPFSVTRGEIPLENHGSVTWSKNPLTRVRCLDGYVAKIPAVAFFPTTISSPWLKSINASGGRIDKSKKKKILLFMCLSVQTSVFIWINTHTRHNMNVCLYTIMLHRWSKTDSSFSPDSFKWA